MNQKTMKSCGVPWGVCPDCLGEGLFGCAGESWCRRCGRKWRTSEVEPCPIEATELLSDGQSTSRVCASHAAHSSASKLRPERVGALSVFPGGAGPRARTRRIDDAPEAYGGTNQEDFLDCAGRLRTFRLQELSAGLFLEATELHSDEPTGMRFVIPAISDGLPTWGELRDLIRKRLSQRDVVQTPRGLELLRADLRGQIKEGEELPHVLVDDLELRWEELGELLKAYIGFGLRLQVCQAGEE